MPPPVAMADVHQQEQVADDATWEDLSIGPIPTEPDAPTIERQSVDVDIKDLFSSLSSQNWRRAAKDIFHIINGTEQAVRGLGFQVHGMEDLTPERRTALLVEVENRDQSALEWPDKLECAALRTAAQTSSPGSDEARNAQIVKHLREHSQTGDLIFVSSEGAGEPLLAEVFQTAFRTLSARSEMDFQFPFWHVLVNVGDGKLLHMTFKGLHETTWERLLLKSDAYDAVAVGRIDASHETREQLAQEARKFAEDRHYNYLWALLTGPVSLMQRQQGVEIQDTSATTNRSVCLDFATEAARALRAGGAAIGDDIENAVTPLDLFSASSLKIVEASALKRVA